MSWVKLAWDEISEELIAKSFVVTGISAALDGSQDDMIAQYEPEASSDEEDLFSDSD